MDEGQVAASGRPGVSEDTEPGVATGKVALSLRGLALLVLGAVIVGMLGLLAGRSLFAGPAPEAPLAPEITLPSIQGGQVSLNDYQGRKNVVLVFYRGAFWGFCQKQLGELQKDYEEIKRYDAEIVAISVDDLNTSTDFAAQYGLQFPILSDTERQAITAYGILHPEENVARPSVFIVDRQGRVRWSYIGQDAADRPDNKLIIEELKKLD